ncbi:hypothetical protein QO259_17200 [Salinicola sp. JS01]|uniref:hypothetical protein n=1 Tax=Salinicola sp. JS01 TaxID=3050071 RepID=UPI00255B5C68|nr:hypothetical protein [Salinicola sp. JS01]WIX32525.1 hypothetical protein QO259_17200 [Salinicola sp. JS01]
MNNAIRSIADDKTRAFAEACYDTNDLNDLREMTEADETDMAEWKIDANQWRTAVNAAIADMEADAE